ncbi:MAG: RdgB/HAM1 family non-canonical purine NTP pyrophosphatase [Flavobacteriales bacterium]|nr:RdgB/HAM1 family non-canonical purine NTP pyrophosphatase [Flavobacteriales bacterium]
MEIVFASNNAHKLEEVRSKLPKEFTVLLLKDVLGEVDIPETGETLDANASIKSRYVFERTGKNCFSDDTGLEISALNGEPGVYSARYAGEGCSFQDNMDKVLAKMKGAEDRSACFRTVISLILNGEEHFFEGRVDGEILTEEHGEKGFGYDPIFRPNGFNESFAEMTLAQKNDISHRGLAVQKLVDFLASR